jgi:hypothetical protein
MKPTEVTLYRRHTGPVLSITGVDVDGVRMDTVREVTVTDPIDEGLPEVTLSLLANVRYVDEGKP